MLSQAPIGQHTNPSMLNRLDSSLTELSIKKPLQGQNFPINNLINWPDRISGLPTESYITPGRVDNMDAWLNKFKDDYLNYGLDLKSISYFDLLDEVPNIKKLFSNDYRNLVSQLVEIQENSKVRDLDQIEKLNLDSNVLVSVQDTGISSRAGGNSVSENLFLNQKNQEQESNQNFNHLFLQQNQSLNTKDRPKTEAPTNRFYQNSNTTPKPYENKKKDKKSKSLSQNLLKSLIKNLNQFSRNLSKFVQQ